MKNLGLDIRYALRRLASTPLFTVFAVVSLAIGIGSTTAIYSAAYELVLRPSVMGNADEVVDIYHRESLEGEYSYFEYQFSLPDFRDLHDMQTRFTHISAWRGYGGPVTTEDRAEYVSGEAVDGEFFSVVGVHAVRGRLLQNADNEVGALPVAVIGYAFWERWFGRDPGVIGRKFRVREQSYEIVGVAEPDFRGVTNPNLRPTSFWVPLLPVLRADRTSARLMNHRNGGLLDVKARLKPGVSLEAARADVARVAGIVDGKSPIVWERDFRRLVGPREWFVTPTVKRFSTGASFAVSLVTVLMSAVGLVLLVACTNLANLMLARASRRRQEFAVRVALGASRWRLVREQLVEGFIVAIGGGGLGILVAWLVMQWMQGSARIFGGRFIYLDPKFNASVLAIALVATVLTMLVFSLVPAFHTTKTPVGNMSMGWRGRRLLITAQVVVSTVLITTAFLAAQQLQSVANRDLGVDLDRIAAVHMDFEASHYEEPRARLALDAMADRARRMPGVQNVAIASGFPFNGGGSAQLKSGNRNKGVSMIAGTPEMFSVFGTQLKRGRVLDANDTAVGARVAVVSEGVIPQLFPNGDALGQQITVAGYSFDPSPDEVVTIVGVVAEPNGAAVGQRTNGYLFRPWAQRYAGHVSLVVRSADPVAKLEPLQRLVREEGRDIVIVHAITGSAVALLHNVTPRIVGTVAAILGVFALLLSVIGLYGVLGHIVAGRTREVGVRMALGADRRQIARMILLQGLDPVISGLVLGLILGAAARSVFQPLIVEYFPKFDPVMFVLVPIPFAVAAAIACYLPARRASRVDPLVALRDL